MNIEIKNFFFFLNPLYNGFRRQADKVLNPLYNGFRREGVNSLNIKNPPAM